MKLAPVNHNISFKFLNPYYFLSDRTPDDNFLNLLINFFKFEVILNNKYLLTSLILFFPYLYKINKKQSLSLLFSFGLLLATIFSNNLRYFELYEIYTFLAFLFFFIFLNKENFFKIKFLSISLLLILTVNNTFNINNFNKYFNRISYFENCNTSNWILLKNNNGLKEWLPWTKKFDENFYKRICFDVLKKNI